MVSEPCRTIERIYNSTLRNEHNGAGNKSARMDESGHLHAGSLIIDITCCDAEVKYPTDLDVFECFAKMNNSANPT